MRFAAGKKAEFTLPMLSEHNSGLKRTAARSRSSMLSLPFGAATRLRIGRRIGASASLYLLYRVPMMPRRRRASLRPYWGFTLASQSMNSNEHGARTPGSMPSKIG